MSEYWKSTPSYWCKFCSTYVKDTPIERKNHEASGKHQGSIQRSLRDLHKNKAYEERDKQRAKDEVARLNGLANGKSEGGSSRVNGLTDITHNGTLTSTPVSAISAAAQRRKHAQELVALGVELPPELKQEITGVGSWQTVSETVVKSQEPRSMAAMMKEEQESKGDVLNRGIHKRKADGEDVQEDGAEPKKNKAWGSNFKSYPGSKAREMDETDLNALLNGIVKIEPKEEKDDDANDSSTRIKLEENENARLLEAPSSIDNALNEQTDDKSTTTAVVFKKRKGKR